MLFCFLSTGNVFVEARKYSEESKRNQFLVPKWSARYYVSTKLIDTMIENELNINKFNKKFCKAEIRSFSISKWKYMLTLENYIETLSDAIYGTPCFLLDSNFLQGNLTPPLP